MHILYISAAVAKGGLLVKGHVGVGWGGSCRGGVGCVMQGWGGVGGSYRGQVGWVM